MSQKKQRKQKRPNGIETQKLRDRFYRFGSPESEGSAYWNWKGHQWGEEDPRGNPDQLPESASIIGPAQVLSVEQEAQAEAYYRLVAHGGLKDLSEQEREIWRLMFEDWKEPSEIGKILNLTTSAVHSAIKRAGEKIKKLILKDLENEQALNEERNKLA